MRRLGSVRLTLVVALAGGCATPSSPVTHAPASASRERSSAAHSAASIDPEQLVPVTPIEVTVQRYASDVRFRLFDSAVSFVEPELRSQFRAATDYLRTIRFTGVTIEEVEVDESGTTAVATVRWRGHWLNSPFERERRVTQRWRRDEPSRQWYVTPELEALGANLEQLRQAPAASMSPR